MSWIAILMFVVEHLPDLIKIIKEIIALIGGLSFHERLAVKREIGEAIKSGDLDVARATIISAHTKCLGQVGCPVEVKND